VNEGRISSEEIREWPADIDEFNPYARAGRLLVRPFEQWARALETVLGWNRFFY